MATQVSYETTDSTKTGSTSTLNSYYQSFIPSVTFALKAWQININSIVSGSARAAIWFYNADADGKPTGTELGGAGPIASLFTSNTGWQGTSVSVFPTMIAGNRYCIRIQGRITSGSYEFNFDSNDGYADGTAWYWNGSSYVAQNGDINFRIIGDSLTAPEKPTNPTPSDEDTSVDFSGLVLDWDDGGGADTFDVYMGPSGSLVKVADAIAPSTYTVSIDDVPWGETIYWRVDATNSIGTTTGDEWSFSVVNINSVWLGSAGNFIVVVADNGVFLSTDFGDNWAKKTPDAVGTTDWVKGICSDDGTYIIVVSSANAIYRSANSGTAWATITPAGGDSFSVNGLATSDDGQYMVIVGQNSTDATESCYISTDYGVTWTAKKPVDASIEWTDCDITNDGAVIAVSTSGYFYISLDSGATWLEQGMASSAEVWEGLSISGDGTTGLVANTHNNNEVFLGTNTELYSEATWAESGLTSAGRAILDDADAPAQATTLGLGTGNTPEFVSTTLSGLTASRLVATNASKVLVSLASPLIVTEGGTGLATITNHGILLGSGTSAITPLGVAANGQIPIGSAGADPVLATVTGIANRVTVANAAGSITLSLPQDYHTGASPTLAGLTLTNVAVIGSNSIVFQPNADSTTFFQVLDADGGTPIFNIDTTNKRVGIRGPAFPVINCVRETSLTSVNRGSFTVSHKTSGNMSNGFGISFTLAIEDATSGLQPIAQVQGNRRGSDDSGEIVFITYVNGAGYKSLVIDPDGDVHIGVNRTANLTLTGRLGINELNPETLTEWTSTVPYLTLHCDDETDDDGGRKSRFNFKGHQSGGEETTLARIEIEHDGTGDDEKGKIVISTNAGSDTNTPTDQFEIQSTGDWVINKTSGVGIKVDLAAPTFGWRDLLGNQFSKNTGGTKPTLTTYNGAVDAWQFSDGDEAFLSYHIPHDYVPGTDIHLHVHWSQNNAGATGGTIDFKYFAIYAKGHNQASGSVFTSTPITATFSSIDINDGDSGLSQYQHHLTEVVISAATATAALFDKDDLEPDGVIELTLEMDANNLTGTPSDPFIHFVDIHYQSMNLATKQKAPDFYT